MHLRLQVLLLNMIKRIQKIKWKQYWIYRNKKYMTDHQIILIVLWNWQTLEKGLVVQTNDFKNHIENVPKNVMK